MAKIVDPDSLTLIVDGSPTTEEVSIDTDAKTVELRVAGNLDDASPGSTSGVTEQCLYSFLKEEWKANATLNKFKFPIKAIYEAKFIWRYGWQPANAQTRDLIRDAGHQEIDGAEYACVISLGSMYNDSQVSWYANVVGFDQTTNSFDKTGPIDELIQIYDGGSNDYRDYLKVFNRNWERTFSSYNLLVEQGLSALTYIAYRAPLANADDINSDGTVTTTYIDGANDPYQDMELQYYVGSLFAPVTDTSYTLNQVVQEDNGAGSRWFRCTTAGTVTGSTGVAQSSWGGTSSWEAYPGERSLDGGTTYYAFNRAVQYNGVASDPSIEQIYLFTQRQLLLSTDINDDPDTDSYGTVYGNVAIPLAYFVGDKLHSWPGTYFDDFDSNDTNDIVIHDITVGTGASYGLDSEDVPNTSTERTFPFVAAGTIVFSDNIVAEADVDTKYTMFFQYTNRQTRTDFAVTSASGATATLTTVAGDLSGIASGDYFVVSGFLTNDDNNGVKEATGQGVTGSVAYTDALGRTQIDETAGDSVVVDEHSYDTNSAIIVDDNSSTDITGQVTTKNTTFDFDYTNNNQGGRTANTDAPIVIVCQGLSGAEWIFAEFTITQATGLSFPINPADELTYLNPT